jgi:Co/Zn/Cd efflux system component
MRIVIGITAAMTVLEIIIGLMSHSMALLADGWHMSTHVLAFLITAVAYHFARTQADNARFSFGTGKIGVLEAESDGDSAVTDLHVWQVGIGKFAAMVSIVAQEPKSCNSYRALLGGYHELVHVTIETHHCPEDHASIASA